MDDAIERFTALYDRWYPRVLAYALTHNASHAAEDIVSETFMVAWRRLEVVPDPPLPWLLGVARNIGLKQYDSGRRQAALAARIAALTNDADTQAWDVAELVIDRDAAIQVLAGLSADDLELLVLTVWQGLDARAVAKVLGCSRAAVFVRLHRARRRLDEALGRAATGADQRTFSPAAA